MLEGNLLLGEQSSDMPLEFISSEPLWWTGLAILVLLGMAFSLVDQPFWKRAMSAGFRILGILLLVAGLCRPYAFQQKDAAHLVYLVDVSQSVDLNASRQAIQTIEQGIQNLPPSDTWSLYAVANGVRRFDSASDLQKWVQQLQGDQFDDRFRSETRLGEALLATRLDFQSDRSKRFVVYSDGRQTDEGIQEILGQMRQEGIDVRWSRVAGLKTAEAALLSLEPTTRRAYTGEVVRMTVETSCNQEMNGKLRLIHRGVAVQQQDVKLKSDQINTFWFDVDMVTPGESHWSVELIAEQDHFSVNNQRACTISVQGKPRLLILHREPQELRTVTRALEEQNLVVETRGEFGLPTSMEGLLAFDGIVLADLPATSMSPGQMNLLASYVKDFGGGLAMLGSENSFGLGGYHKTPVEEVIPLISRFEKEKEKPSLSMVLVIDKSGSMDGMPIALARQAAKSAAELLGARDQIAVVGFDSSPVIVSEMRSAVEKGAIQNSIDSLAADGGTDMYPAMVVAKDMLEATPSKIKHMICLGDGQTPGNDFEGLVQALNDSGITVSTVALGQADRGLLSMIAEQGKGRYYETNDPANVPQIFTRETMQASQSAIKEDLYGSIQAGDHPILSGFQDADLPFTLGFVMTQAKPTSQLLLVTETGDPLLAVGRYGLGTGMAFTCDLSERWGGEWLAWDQCGKFWGQVFRGMVRRNDTSGLSVRSTAGHGRWDVEIVRKDETGTPIARVPWDIGLVKPNGQLEPVAVQENGLGRYDVSVPLQSDQSLTLRIRDTASDKISVLHYDPPYPGEYRLGQQLDPAVESLTDLPGGNPREGLQPVAIRQPVSHYFALAGLVSILLGILLRRI